MRMTTHPPLHENLTAAAFGSFLVLSRFCWNGDASGGRRRGRSVAGGDAGRGGDDAGGIDAIPASTVEGRCLREIAGELLCSAGRTGAMAPSITGVPD